MMLEHIQFLRKETGAGIMDCKSALLAANGDVTKATSILMEKGFQLVQKKAERTVESGASYATVKNGVAVLVNLRSETPFVASNPKFLDFAGVIAEAAAAYSSENVEQLLAQPTPIAETTVQDLLQKMIMTFRENIVIQSIHRLEDGEGAYPYAYMHQKGRIGVILQMMKSTAPAEIQEEIAKELSLQIASMSPQVVRREDLAEAQLREMQHEIDQEMEADPSLKGKPSAVLEKIRGGKLEKQLSQICLLEQPYIRDDSINIGQFLKQQEKVHGVSFEIKRFIRHEQVVDLENASYCAVMRF